MASEQDLRDAFWWPSLRVGPIAWPCGCGATLRQMFAWAEKHQPWRRLLDKRQAVRPGEALIMTGIGLAVAIPAVVAYNAFTRGNRVLNARLDAFAFELVTFLSMGRRCAPVPPRRANVRPLRGTAAPA